MTMFGAMLWIAGLTWRPDLQCSVTGCRNDEGERRTGGGTTMPTSGTRMGTTVSLWLTPLEKWTVNVQTETTYTSVRIVVCGGVCAVVVIVVGAVVVIIVVVAVVVVAVGIVVETVAVVAPQFC